jgi:glutamate-1-semialdehyde 2,1-aminomutase
LGQLRELTAAQGVLLIFDEVVTGFRCSPGGAQAHFGITPDLTTLAKILAGGFPGGAVCGRKDLLDWLDFEASAAAQREKIPHQGTFNANPVSAAAGATMLNLVATTDACQRANDYAARLRASLQEVLQQESVDWYVYGTFSGFHVLTSPERSAVTATEEGSPPDFRQVKSSSSSSVAKKLRVGMLAHGVDMLGWPGGPTSAAHDDDDLERTVDAFRATLRVMKEEGDL